MILFFIVLTIVFIIISLFLIFCLSNLEIEINRLWFDSNREYKKLEDYLIYVRLRLFGKITWLRIKLDNAKIQKIRNSRILKHKIFKKFNITKNIKENILKNKKDIFKIENIRYIKQLDIKIDKLNLYIDLCTADSIFTAFSVAILASAISMILARNMKKYDNNKYNYMITPIYKNKPSLKVKLSCIINIKIVHIINVIYMLINKKRSVEYDERTSDRRAYVCSND